MGVGCGCTGSSYTCIFLYAHVVVGKEMVEMIPTYQPVSSTCSDNCDLYEMFINVEEFTGEVDYKCPDGTYHFDDNNFSSDSLCRSCNERYNGCSSCGCDPENGNLLECKSILDDGSTHFWQPAGV